MANNFNADSIYIVKKDPVEEGGPHSAVQTWVSDDPDRLPDGYAFVDAQYLDIFYSEGKKIAGFVNMTYDETSKYVTSMSWDESSYQAYIDKLPAFSISAIPAKLNEISKACSDSINAGTDVTFDESSPESTTFHFDFTTEDQANISSLFNTTLLGATEFPYHYKDGGCQVFTAEQLSKLYISMQTYITHHVTYHNQLKQYIIDEFTGTRDDEHETALRNIVYGATQLEGKYLAKYNEMMGVAQTQVEAVATKLLASSGVIEEGSSTEDSGSGKVPSTEEPSAEVTEDSAQA